MIIQGIVCAPADEAWVKEQNRPKGEATSFVWREIPILVDPRLERGKFQVYDDREAWMARVDEQNVWDNGKQVYSAQVAELVSEFWKLPQLEMPVAHRFQDGVYIREIFMPADTFVIGHIHKFKHWNIVMSGTARVMMDGVLHEVKAGDVFESEAGVQKILYVEQDMKWLTVHANPTEERDIPTLEESLIEAPDWFLTEKGAMTLDQFRMSLNQTHTLTEPPEGEI